MEAHVHGGVVAGLEAEVSLLRENAASLCLTLSLFLILDEIEKECWGDACCCVAVRKCKGFWSSSRDH